MLTTTGPVPACSSAAFLASGRRTSLPRWSSGVTTMKMMSSTSTTSTRGVTLMSLFGPRTEPVLNAILGYAPGHLVEDLVRRRRDLHGAGVDPGLQVVEGHDRRDGDDQTEGGGHQGLGD